MTIVDDLVGSVYLHVSNSGVTFSVFDKENEGGGAEIRISSSSFGNLRHSLSINTSKDGLESLAKLFADAAKHKVWDDSKVAFCSADRWELQG